MIMVRILQNERAESGEVKLSAEICDECIFFINSLCGSLALAGDGIWIGVHIAERLGKMIFHNKGARQQQKTSLSYTLFKHYLNVLHYELHRIYQ